MRCQTQKHSRDPALVTKMCEHVTFHGEESADGFDLRSFSGKEQLNRRFQEAERDIGEHHRATWSWKEEDGWQWLAVAVADFADGERRPAVVEGGQPQS